MPILASFKRALKQARSAVRGPWMTRGRLARGLAGLGVRRGGVLLVHSSLSSLGYVPGGPATVIAGLLDAIGPSGTLVLPTHSWAVMSRGCREFDVRRTPSCVGQITEAFRQQPGVLRSLHPTHSVAARGPLAAELIAGHQQADTPCGAGTPYARVIEHAGQILFLGCGLERNTVYHTLEALAGLPYLMQDSEESFTLIDAEGRAVQRSIRRHRGALPRRFHQTVDFLSEHQVLRQGRVGRANCYLLESQPLAELMLRTLASRGDFLLASEPAAGAAVE